MGIKKTILINQSGALGDIFCVAPIARWYYLRGYLVYWPVRERYFHLLQEYFPYVLPLMIDQEKADSYKWDTGDWLRDDSLYNLSITHSYDKVLDLADRGPVPQQRGDETFEEYKYRVAGVPYKKKHNLIWRENNDKQIKLFRTLAAMYADTGYCLAHLTSSHGDRARVPEGEDLPVIEVIEVPGYEIPDWIEIIVHAKRIYCVESAVHQFIDGIGWRRGWEHLFLLSRSSLQAGERYTKSEHWDTKYMV